jgi:hypothetical protein
LDAKLEALCSGGDKKKKRGGAPKDEESATPAENTPPAEVPVSTETRKIVSTVDFG